MRKKSYPISPVAANHVVGHVPQGKMSASEYSSMHPGVQAHLALLFATCVMQVSGPPWGRQSSPGIKAGMSCKYTNLISQQMEMGIILKKCQLPLTRATSFPLLNTLWFRLKLKCFQVLPPFQKKVPGDFCTSVSQRCVNWETQNFIEDVSNHFSLLPETWIPIAIPSVWLWCSLILYVSIYIKLNMSPFKFVL